MHYSTYDRPALRANMPQTHFNDRILDDINTRLLNWLNNVVVQYRQVWKAIVYDQYRQTRSVIDFVPSQLGRVLCQPENHEDEHCALAPDTQMAK